MISLTSAATAHIHDKPAEDFPDDALDNLSSSNEISTNAVTEVAPAIANGAASIFLEAGRFDLRRIEIIKPDGESLDGTRGNLLKYNGSLTFDYTFPLHGPRR